MIIRRYHIWLVCDGIDCPSIARGHPAIVAAARFPGSASLPSLDGTGYASRPLVGANTQMEAAVDGDDPAVARLPGRPTRRAAGSGVLLDDVFHEVWRPFEVTSSPIVICTPASVPRRNAALMSSQRQLLQRSGRHAVDIGRGVAGGVAGSRRLRAGRRLTFRWADEIRPRP